MTFTTIFKDFRSLTLIWNVKDDYNWSILCIFGIDKLFWALDGWKMVKEQNFTFYFASKLPNVTPPTIFTKNGELEIYDMVPYAFFKA